MEIILDILLIFFILFFIWRGFRKGFLQTITSFAGLIAATFLAGIISTMIANMVFTSFVAPEITKKINVSMPIQITESTEDIDSKVDEVYNKLPTYVLGLIGDSTEIKDEVTKTLKNEFENGTANISDVIINTIVKPIFVLIIRSILFIFLFAIFMIVLRIILKAIRPLDNIPILGTLNSILGGVVGLLKAILYVFLLCVLIKLFINIGAGQNTIGYEKTINSSMFFNIIYNHNFLA